LGWQDRRYHFQSTFFINDSRTKVTLYLIWEFIFIDKARLLENSPLNFCANNLKTCINASTFFCIFEHVTYSWPFFKIRKAFLWNSIQLSTILLLFSFFLAIYYVWTEASAKLVKNKCNRLKLKNSVYCLYIQVPVCRQSAQFYKSWDLKQRMI